MNMPENINRVASIEKSKAAELSRIKEALVAFQEIVLSIRNPDQLSSQEFEGLGVVGDKLIEYGWPLGRVLDLYYGMRPDATKPELPTRAMSELMVVSGNHDESEMDRVLEAGEEYNPTGADSFQMPFGRQGFMDIDRLLPPSGKREPLPYLEKP